MASPSATAAALVVVLHVQGVPSSAAAVLVVVIRHVHGVRFPHGAGSGGGDPARLGRPLPSRCAGAGMIRRVRGPLFLPSHGGRRGGDDPGSVQGVPFRHGCGCWGRRGRACLWWYSYCQHAILEYGFIDQ